MDVTGLGKCRLKLLFKLQSRCLVFRVGDKQMDGPARLVPKSLFHVMGDGCDHHIFGLLYGPGLGEGIQLLPLDLKYRLQL